MTTKTILRSNSLTCPSCVPKIEKALKAQPGVTSAMVRFASGKIEVEHDPGQTSGDDLVKTVQSVGYASRISPV
jgi:copper chaperone CopZ